jgi:predicted alpha-1,6-mannanase (GH76 family)
MKKIILCAVIFAFLLSSCDSYKDEYIEVSGFPKYSWEAAVDSSTTAFVSRYWNTTTHFFNNTFDGGIGLYDYWPEAHALDVVTDAYLRTGDNAYKQIIDDWYEGVRAKNGTNNNWRNSYYDDMGWHGLAHMRAFEATGDSRYEESAENLWHWITEGWTEYDGGGIQWRVGTDDQSISKGIPANGPACIIAARRAQKYPDEVVNGYTNLEWARRIYEWMKYNRTVLSTGRIFERYDDTRGDYAYDYGTFIGSAIELYNHTQEKAYLNDALKVAGYHISSNINTNYRVMRDYGEQTGEGNGHDVNLFKGIFVRYFAILIQHPEISEGDRKRFVNFLKHNANYLWTYGTQKSPVIKFSPTWWEIPASGAWGDLRSAISAATTIEAVALLEKEGLLK